jgi:hypothetical protein
MRSQICIAFYFKFSAFWPLRLWGLEILYLLIYIKPHGKSGDNKLDTLMNTNWTLRFHKPSPHCLIHMTPNIQRTFENWVFMSSSWDPVSRNNNQELDLGLSSSYNILCICLKDTKNPHWFFYTSEISSPFYCVTFFTRHENLDILRRSSTVLHAGFMLMESMLFPCHKFAHNINVVNITEW